MPSVARCPLPVARCPLRGDRRSAAFTLIELSIVLVIIGLLLGGVLIGKDMIRQSQLRSVVSDMQSYLTASQMFQEKYNCIPGDCANATTFWSASNNGNGNGQIEQAGSANAIGEAFETWKQLALARFIKGSFSGNAGPGSGSDAIIGVNVPKARFPLVGYSLGYHGNYSGTNYVYDGVYGNDFRVGAKQPNSDTSATVFKPAESYQIDQKLDDGIPGTGIIRAYATGAAFPNNCSTGTNATGTASAYNIAYSGVACAFFFISGF